ncbi:hypothetical protein F3Y22_tig00109983pilonHSYRG00077 [Hibiscus syriacus]|uniref:Uncharacterized protein n=1 Tax=Hibiscus syriacus TaxID=106335 RepID=A0A6A3BQY0_HIBSY|nr:hypothetical protein F3Y22_tig00109983pilonHSYRG00077 [Hibiscus syriacus]
MSISDDTHELGGDVSDAVANWLGDPTLEQESGALKSKIAELEVTVQRYKERIQQLKGSQLLTNQKIRTVLIQANDTIQIQHESMKKTVE